MQKNTTQSLCIFKKPQPESRHFDMKESAGARNGHIRRSPSQINFKHANFSRRTLWEGSGSLEGQLFFKSRRDEDPGPCFQKILVLDFGWVLTFGSDLAKMQWKGAGKKGFAFFWVWKCGFRDRLGRGTGPKLSYIDFGLFWQVHLRLWNSRYTALAAAMSRPWAWPTRASPRIPNVRLIQAS